MSDIRQEKIKERNQEIVNLYLLGNSYSEIEALIGVSDSTIGRIIDSQKSQAAEMGPPESLQLYNVWNFPRSDQRYGLDYPGRIPGQIVENLLYYYTEPFDLIVEPMAGGGTTIDVCKAMYRRCLAYDINPVRDDIKEHDIHKGFPERTRNCDLIFLDPPLLETAKRPIY